MRTPLYHAAWLTYCIAITFSCFGLRPSCSASEAGDLLQIDEQFIPVERPWRRPERKLTPQFITVHSTGNTAPGTNALAHSKLLSSKEGLRSMNPLSRTGYKSWHFTVDDQRIVQHLPTSEQGDHADFTGPGNQQSIGIEMRQP